MLSSALPRSGFNAPQGTVPVILDDNRMFAALAFVRPDGTLRKTLAFVDIAAPAPVLSENLFKELQIDQHKPLVFRIGKLEARVEASDVSSDPGSLLTGPNGRASMPVEAVLPGSVMKNYQVIVDYAKHVLVFAQPHTFAPKGSAVPCRVNDKTGLISVDVGIGGQTYAIAVDTGSAYTWMRSQTVRQWLTSHPGWKRGEGAVGESNMQTRSDKTETNATIIRLPEIRLGSLHLKEVGALGITAGAPPFPPAPGESVVRGDFFDWYSKKAPAPVIGWLGGNVLKGFRIMIDFPNRMTYWERESDLDPHDLDQVGIVLETLDTEEGYFVAGVAEKDGKATVEGVQPGDRLIQVDQLHVSRATRGALFSALHGHPGAIRTLTLERHGQKLTVQTKITAF